MQNLTRELIKDLFIRFSVIFGEKFAKFFSHDELFNCWCDEWHEGLAGIDATHLKDAIACCRANLEWSPSVAEFRTICERIGGMPTVDEVMKMAIARELSHPIVQAVFEKIGDWNMRYDSSDSLKKKFAQAYKEAISDYRMAHYRKFVFENNKKGAQIISIDSHLKNV
jgi:hypothetical protein